MATGAGIWIGAYSIRQNSYNMDGYAWTDRTPFDYHRWDQWDAGRGACVSLHKDEGSHTNSYMYRYNRWRKTDCGANYNYLCQKTMDK